MRRNHGPTLDLTVIGTECNRSHGCQTNPSVVNPEKINFPGEKKLTKTVNKTIAKTLKELAPRLLVFISLHSNTERIMYPWGYTKYVLNR